MQGLVQCKVILLPEYLGKQTKKNPTTNRNLENENQISVVSL